MEDICSSAQLHVLLTKAHREASWNEAQRRHERRRSFNVHELKRLAAASVKRSPAEIVKFEKLTEGGFNRTFILSMRDGFEMIARIPYLTAEPRRLLLASEVATMYYLRARDIPIPEVYSYSTTSDNPAGTEYIFMAVQRGMNLGDI